MNASESVKRQCRHLSDVVHRSDNSKNDISLRQRIRDQAEALIFVDPLEFGRKGEDTLWRKAYYELYSEFKNKSNGLTISKSAVERHLTSGIGAYHHLLSRLETDYGIEVAGITGVSVKLTNEFYLPVGKRLKDSPEDRRPSLHEWGISCAHRCFVAQGDLSRYLYELKGSRQGCPHRHAALRHYQQAILLKPEMGQPFNQMATLEGNSLFGLRAVYYFLRSSLCSEPFVAAESNLKASLERSRAQLRKLLPENSKQLDEEIAARTLIDFVSELQGFPNEGIPQERISEKIKTTQMSDECMYFIALILLAVWKKFEKDEQKVSLIQELLLTLARRTTGTVYRRLCEKTCVYYPTGGQRYSTPKMEELTEENGEKLENEDPLPMEQKSKVRRRRRMSGCDSDQDEGFAVKSRVNRRKTPNRDSSSEGASSDDNGSWISSDEFELSDSSESEENSLPEVEQEKETEKPSEAERTPSKDYLLDPAFTMRQLVKQISSEKLLGALKLLLDWISIDSSIVKDDLVFLKKLADLANLLFVFTQKISVAEDSTIGHVRPHLQSLQMDGCEALLPEDIQFPLMGKDPKECRNWEVRAVMKSEGQRTVYRIAVVAQRITKLCQSSLESSVEIKPFEHIIFGEEILAKIRPEDSMSDGMGDDTKPGKGGERQEALMKTMAQAWLQHEVKGLEKQLRKDNRQKSRTHAGHVTIRYEELEGPFIVLDASALAHSLVVIKEIASSKKKLIVVPTCVIGALDEMKKDVPSARDAIRWLENELMAGSPLIRAQKSGQSKVIPLLKYPKRKERGPWQLFNILECCKYFKEKENPSCADESEKGDGDCSAMVSLVYSKSKSDLPENAASLSKAVGIKLVDVDEIANIKADRPKSRKRSDAPQSMPKMAESAG